VAFYRVEISSNDTLATSKKKIGMKKRVFYLHPTLFGKVMQRAKKPHAQPTFFKGLT